MKHKEKMIQPNQSTGWWHRLLIMLWFFITVPIGVFFGIVALTKLYHILAEIHLLWGVFVKVALVLLLLLGLIIYPTMLVMRMSRLKNREFMKHIPFVWFVITMPLAISFIIKPLRVFYLSLIERELLLNFWAKITPLVGLLLFIHLLIFIMMYAAKRRLNKLKSKQMESKIDE